MRVYVIVFLVVELAIIVGFFTVLWHFIAKCW